MEAWTLAGRERLARAAATATAPGLGPWLLALLVLAGGYAAFANGAIAIPNETRLQLGIAAIGLSCGLGLAAGVLRAGRSPLLWAGVGLLAAFGLWSAISALWSAAPDESWVAANRAIAYAAVAAVAAVAACSSRGAQQTVAIGLAAVSLLVALYALGGKIAPELHLGGFSLDPGGEFSRVRDPIGYWNAVGLLCVMAAPICIWLAAAREPATSVRVGALLALVVFLLTLATTYSRGAFVAYAVVLAVMVGAGPRRLQRLAVGVGAIAGALPAVIVAFSLHDLTTGGLPVDARADDGAILGAVLVLSLAALALAGRELVALEDTARWNARHSRAVWRGLAVAAAAVLLAGTVALASSSRGLTGEISHQVQEFKRPKGGLTNTPDRLISSNGSNRWVWWEEALGAFSDKPVGGWGAGSFPVVRFLYRRYEAPVRSVHSVPLQFLSETGLVGAAIGLGGLAVLGAAAARAVRRSRGIEQSARLALLAAAAAWAAHALVDWDWEIPAVTIPALVAVSVAAAPAAGPGPIAERRPAPALLAIAGVFAALLFAASAGLPSLAETRRVQGLQAAAAGDPGEARTDAKLAHKLNPLAVEPLFTASSLAGAEGDEREQLSLLEEAADMQPENFRTWQRLAYVQAQLGNYSAGAESVRRFAAVNPLLFSQRPGAADLLFPLEAPPSRSPTAFGTPPP
jgi:hypothetical protein